LFFRSWVYAASRTDFTSRESKYALAALSR
jgi:hypothetical protein